MKNRSSLWLVCVLLAAAGRADAGLYNTAEPTEALLDPTYTKFHTHLLILRSLGMDKVEVDNPMRRRYMLQAELARRGAAGNLSVEQTINLSTVLVRRRRPEDAIDLLRPLATGKNFLALSNLATAYYLSGRDEGQRAIDTLDQALGIWSPWEKLSEEQQRAFHGFGWDENYLRDFRQAEEHLLKLFKLRAREPKLKVANREKLDDLFGIRYVGESGEFEVGTIAAAEKKKIKYNTVDILQQLINWLPYDDRLYWQLGELMNAEGNVKAARAIFDELWINRQYRADELRDHRRKLLEAAVADEPDNQDGPVLPPAGVPDAQPVAWSWRPLLVAFGTGIVVAIFGQWQIREIRRRMQRTV
jgi:hypothetical protein